MPLSRVLSWNGAVPADCGAYNFGDLPAAGPTSTATNNTSRVTEAGCAVSGDSTAVGTHTLAAAASDKAGNAATATRTCTMHARTLRGFYPPVDMGGVRNTVKGEATVRLKFEVYKGGTELTDTAAIAGFTQRIVACGTGVGMGDASALASTGGTRLRYDTTGGQFTRTGRRSRRSRRRESATGSP